MALDFDLIIIGGGAAGLFAAANIDKRIKTLILEKKESCGKKLLMAGAGRCNLTQAGDIKDFFNKYGDKKNFIQPALKEFSNLDLIEFLADRGMKCIDIKGKIFPKSENSQDVLDLLLSETQNNQVHINTNEAVNKIKHCDDHFQIFTSKTVYKCKYLLITTGGKSYPSTGSTGDGYTLAESLGHTIIQHKPALTPVFIKDYKFKEISGLSLPKREINLYRNNKKIGRNTGDIGFTHWGLSGPGILDFSRNMQEKDILRINLINHTENEFKNEIFAISASEGKKKLKNFLKRYELSENLIQIIISSAEIPNDIKLAELNKQKRNLLIEMLCNHPFLIEEKGGYKLAMVTSGGVSTKEINKKTMESKLVKNLFFAGEVIDIDGDTGGYNLQAAFSTAVKAIQTTIRVHINKI